VETIESELINNYLRTVALNPNRQPLFRLVWSSDQFEMRHGVFRLHMHGIFIREEKGVKSVPKYPENPDRWVFEQWRPPELVNTPELPESSSGSSGSYEPLYIFEDNDHNPLPLSLVPIQFMVKHIMRKSSSKQLIKSALDEFIERKDKRAEKMDEETIGECTSSDIMSNLHFGEGIIVPHNFEVQSPNRRNK